jgi:hypothetical protein
MDVGLGQTRNRLEGSVETFKGVVTHPVLVHPHTLDVTIQQVEQIEPFSP